MAPGNRLIKYLGRGVEAASPPPRLDSPRQNGGAAGRRGASRASETRERRPRTFEAAWGLTALWAAVVWFFFASESPQQRAADPSPLIIATTVTLLAWCMVMYDAHARVVAQQAIEQLHRLSDREFGAWIAACFQRLGYVVRPSASLWHDGIDLVAERPGQVVLVTCGEYRVPRVDETALGRLEPKLREYGAHRVCYVTTGQLTPEATTWLRGKPIEVWDRGYLAHALRTRRLPPPPDPAPGG